MKKVNEKSWILSFLVGIDVFDRCIMNEFQGIFKIIFKAFEKF